MKPAMKNKSWINPWGSEGLPPIGTVCEYTTSLASNEWHKCEVVAHYNESVVALDTSNLLPVFMHPMMFRPIKTPEQIAEEEREKTIEDMFEIVMTGTSIRHGVEALYDEGYRKTEVKK